jgi:hypothetical protein
MQPNVKLRKTFAIRYLGTMRVVIRTRPTTMKRFFGGLVSLLVFGAATSLWLLRLENTEVSFSRNPDPEPPAQAVQQVPVADLILPEATIQGSAERRRVVGRVRNRSSQAHTNIAVIFALTRGSNTVGVAQAFVSRIEGESTVPFQTNEFTHARVKAILKEIMADSR